MVDPDDNVMTVKLEDGTWLSKDEEDCEIRKIETTTQSKTKWGKIDSYHLDKTTLKQLEKSRKRMKQKANEKEMSKKDEVEVLRKKLTRDYKDRKDKEERGHHEKKGENKI